MSIAVVCQHCSKAFRVKDEFAGLRGKCPACQGVIHVPKSDEYSVAEEPAAASPTSYALEPVALPEKPYTITSTVVLGPDAEADEPAPLPKAPVPDKSPAELQAEILAGFQGETAKTNVSLAYRFGILLVTAVMVLLPVIYVAAIGLLGYAIYYHMINHIEVIGMARGRGVILTAGIYVAPLVVGLILLVFMVKPLFARPIHEGRTRSLTRQGEPLLFAFVDRLCEALHSPLPKEIRVDAQVNASAGFRHGYWSMFGNDLVLTIGVPLVAGLSMQQFAGVLAHEFGHFTQGGGMRLTYVTRRISDWFTRLVYERDEWDAWLAESTEGLDLRIAWVLLLAQFCVELTRRFLWLLMMLGHAVSGFMLRQMEYHADLHQTRMAGSEIFEATLRRVRALDAGSHEAMYDLSDWHRRGTLADNLPKLIAAHSRRLKPSVKKKIDQHIEDARTQLLDTHPCDRSRIARSQLEQAAGLFHGERPATALFTDFASLSKNVTWDFYRAIFGVHFKPADMHPLEDLLPTAGPSPGGSAAAV